MKRSTLTKLVIPHRRLCQVAGYSSTNLVGKSYYELVHPQDSKMVQEAFASCGYFCYKLLSLLIMLVLQCLSAEGARQVPTAYCAVVVVKCWFKL